MKKDSMGQITLFIFCNWFALEIFNAKQPLTTFQSELQNLGLMNWKHPLLDEGEDKDKIHYKSENENEKDQNLW